jgi:hypothetical protein
VAVRAAAARGAVEVQPAEEHLLRVEQLAETAVDLRAALLVQRAAVLRHRVRHAVAPRRQGHRAEAQRARLALQALAEAGRRLRGVEHPLAEAVASQRAALVRVVGELDREAPGN